jgi:prepilin-type N-terminal cleavage/methylation domain-containing protein
VKYIKAQRGFSLIELLLAIFILGIGIISIATLFPAGIAQQQKTTDDIIGPIVARNAMTILRSRLSQDDFGGAEPFEDQWAPFLCQFSLTQASINPWPTICGDWMWRRPGIVPEEYGQGDDPIAVGLRGAIDIFGTPFTDVYNGNGTALTEDWTDREGVKGDLPDDSEYYVPVPGIPYNRIRYPSFDIPEPPGSPPDTTSDDPGTPKIRILASERQYPMWEGLPENRPKAQYYWDCMFRRYEGRVLVAIFVYRVIDPSQTGAYTVDTRQYTTPNLPVRINLNAESSTGSWNAGSGNDTLTDSELDDPQAQQSQWQYPGQWIVDQNGNVHTVQNGRRRANDTDPVRLTAPPSAIQVFSTSSNNVQWWDQNYSAPSSGLQHDGVVTDIWFIPTSDTKGRKLIPVFAMVEAL